MVAQSSNFVFSFPKQIKKRKINSSEDYEQFFCWKMFSLSSASVKCNWNVGAGMGVPTDGCNLHESEWTKLNRT